MELRLCLAGWPFIVVLKYGEPMTNREKFATVCIALILATLAVTIVTLAMRFKPTYTNPYIPTFQYYVDALPC